MKTLTLAFTLTFAVCGSALAAVHEHDMPQQPLAQPAASQSYGGSGVLKEIDTRGGRLKIAHEPIAALHWPAMTMWFALRQPLPAGLHTGERVRFEMEQQQQQWVITRIERSH